MNIPDELLAAYVDGELEGAEHERVEQAIVRDLHLAQRVAYHRALRERLRDSFDGTLHEPIPERLLEAAKRALPGGSAQVIDLSRVRAERTRRNGEPQRLGNAYRYAIAASLLVGLGVGLFLERLSGSSTLTEYQRGAVVARGALARALSAQLASTVPADAAVRVGLSFKAKDGRYCRTFAINDQRSLSGLACHEQDRWQVETLLDSGAATERSGFRMAASGLPAPLLQAVNERISGEPLDAEAESAARDRGWH